MRRSILRVSRRSQRTLKAIPIPGLALFVALVLVAVVNTVMPMPAFAFGTVAPLDAWPATPQMTATTGNLAGTFAVSAGTDRLLVVLVCDYDSAGSSGQTFTATYGGKTLTQAILQNDNGWQTWIGYLKETDIASRTGNAITVTVTGTHTQVSGYIASYSGVDQTTPVTAANGVYINNLDDQPIGGPLTVNSGGYGIYGWSGTGGKTRTSDTETYTEDSDVKNGGPGSFDYGVASKAFATTGTTNPSVHWSGANSVSVSFITLNPDSYPVPTTTSISPTTKTVGDAGFTLTVNGTNFVSGASVVRLDGANRTTTFVSSNQLTATIPASDLTTAGGKSITVFNPTPGGGTSNAQTLTVNKATPTITWANPADIVYGTTLSSTQLRATASIPGTFLYSPDFGALLLAGSGQTLHVDFTPTDSANYNNASKDVTINVNKATLTITASNRTKTYCTIVTFAGTEFTPSGLVGSDTVTSVTLTSAGAAASATVSGSPYAIVPTAAVGTGLGNYSISYVNGTLTVNPKALTITANNRSKTYGTTVTFAGTEFTTSGLVGSDTVTGVTLTSAGAAAGAAVSGSPYAIVPSAAVGTGLGNYDITYDNGTLTVSVRDIEVTADDAGKIYGGADPALTYQITSGSLAAGDAFTGATAREAGEDVGTCVIQQGTVALNSNYNLTFVEGTFTISVRNITVTADNKGKTYGDADPALTYQITSGSLAAGDAFTGVIAREAGEDVGTYVIQQGTLALNSNYNPTFVEGTFTIGPKVLTITANSPSKTYGDTVIFAGIEFTIDGLVNGDTVTSITLASAGAAAGAAVGTYDIMPSAAVGTGLANYTIRYVNGTLTMNPKALTITANSRSKTYGDTVTFAGTEFTTGGLVNGDTVTSITLTSGGAGESAAVGTYDIMPSAAVGTGLGNYTINCDSGFLAVNKANTSASVSSLSDPPTSGHSVTFTATVSGTGATGAVTFKDGETVLGSTTLSNGTTTYTTSTLSVGDHSITAVYGGDANFAGSTSSAVRLTVKAAAVVKWDLMGGRIAVGILVGPFFLMLIFPRIRKPKDQAQT